MSTFYSTLLRSNRLTEDYFKRFFSKTFLFLQEPAIFVEVYKIMNNTMAHKNLLEKKLYDPQRTIPYVTNKHSGQTVWHVEIALTEIALASMVICVIALMLCVNIHTQKDSQQVQKSK